MNGQPIFKSHGETYTREEELLMSIEKAKLAFQVVILNIEKSNRLVEEGLRETMKKMADLQTAQAENKYERAPGIIGVDRESL